MRPINLSEPPHNTSPWYAVKEWPLFMLAFRPMFLCAAIWGLLCVMLWAGMLTGHIAWHSQIPATLWHAHEMIFAFSGAVAVGFLLTAAQNWTNIPSASGYTLLLLSIIWCITRWVFFTSPNLLVITLVGQASFWLLAIAILSNMLLRAQSKRNYIFIGVLSALCVANVLFLTMLLKDKFELARVFSHTAVLIFMLLIGVIGGRVIPFFTARGLGLSTQVRTPKLDNFLLWISPIGIVGFVSSQAFSAPFNPGYIIAVTAILHLLRCKLWFKREILKVPLLWSLHLGYLFGALGLLLLSSSFIWSFITFSNALHLITMGGIGLLILSMMARVSLGHTGRPLQVPFVINLAFLAVALGALCRAFLPYWIMPHQAWLSSAALWCVGLCLFVIHYAQVLTQKRVDGRRG